ncbi:response regulator [Trichothermofontia sp.]
MRKILAIEPEKSLQRNSLTLVETEGFYGLGAEDGQRALQLAFAQTPDLILCDTQVPKLDGLTILQSLKYDPEMAQIPFLLLTDQGDRATSQRALALGANYALFKPLKMANLRDPQIIKTL